MAFVIPPSRTMSTLAISMIASVAGSMPVVSMSITRIKNPTPRWLSQSSLKRPSLAIWSIEGFPGLDIKAG
jgi:hypothetical protein